MTIGRYYFMNNVYVSYVTVLGFQLMTPGSTVRRVTDSAMDLGWFRGLSRQIFDIFLCDEALPVNAKTYIFVEIPTSEYFMKAII